MSIEQTTRSHVQSDRLFSFTWYRTLSGDAGRAFWASFLGFALDAFDYQLFSFILTAIAVAFVLTNAQAGLIATVTLVVSALGGVLAGVLADRIGRVKTLSLTIGAYALFTFLSSLAPNYGFLLVTRSLQGLGFGGEWAVGAILIAEVANPRQRGRVLGMIQSSWAVGWALALVASTLVFSFAPQAIAWRIVFGLGILPALLLFFVREKYVKEPAIARETREAIKAKSPEAVQQGATRNSLVQIFRRDLIGTTLPATLLTIGAQGGYYSIFTWLPTFLKVSLGLTVVGSVPYLSVVIAGSFLGYVISGYINDWLGRKRTIMIFAICSAVLIFLYTRIPHGDNTLLIVLGAPLGFFASGIFSGFGSYLAELFPNRARGAGQGFTYNFGRGVGAFFPAIIGVLSTSIGLGGAIGFGAFAYALCVLSLFFLPETRGIDLKTLKLEKTV